MMRHAALQQLRGPLSEGRPQRLHQPRHGRHRLHAVELEPVELEQRLELVGRSSWSRSSWSMVPARAQPRRRVRRHRPRRPVRAGAGRAGAAPAGRRAGPSSSVARRSAGRIAWRSVSLLDAYRRTGADPPFGDPRRAHGVRFEGYYWRIYYVACGRRDRRLGGVSHDAAGRWASVALAADPDALGALRPHARPSRTRTGLASSSRRRLDGLDAYRDAPPKKGRPDQRRPS